MQFYVRKKTLKQLKKQTHLNNRKLLKDIGFHFKLRRLEMSLKAVEVAEKLQISKQLLSNFENGKSNNLLLAILYTEVLDLEDDKQRAKQRAEPPEQFSE